MSRRRSIFRQRDLCAAIKAAKAAGIEAFRIEIDSVSGKMIVIVMGGGMIEEPVNDLDKWVAKHAD
jgi:hypothetical protein